MERWTGYGDSAPVPVSKPADKRQTREGCAVTEHISLSWATLRPGQVAPHTSHTLAGDEGTHRGAQREWGPKLSMGEGAGFMLVLV